MRSVSDNGATAPISALTYAFSIGSNRDHQTDEIRLNFSARSLTSSTTAVAGPAADARDYLLLMTNREPAEAPDSSGAGPMGGYASGMRSKPISSSATAETRRVATSP